MCVKKFWLVLFLILITIRPGFAQNNEKIIRKSISKSEFPLEKKVNGQILSEISKKVISPYYIDVSDSLLVAIDETEKDIFKFFFAE
jgi:hypothetical protein